MKKLLKKLWFKLTSKTCPECGDNFFDEDMVYRGPNRKDICNGCYDSFLANRPPPPSMPIRPKKPEFDLTDRTGMLPSCCCDCNRKYGPLPTKPEEPIDYKSIIDKMPKEELDEWVDHIVQFPPVKPKT